MSAHRFSARLAHELETRRGKNARYSLRAFAAYLGTDHSTLSQVLRGRRRAPARQIRAWAKKLGLGAEEASVWVAVEHPDSEADRQWTAEAMGIVTERVHWQILDLCRAPEFRADSRWVAERTGVSTDEVNLALSRLLRLGLLEMNAGRWKERTGLREFTETEFRKIALTRVINLCQTR
jgi:transcriptional regulator with XRE-family HTH domain